MMKPGISARAWQGICDAYRKRGTDWVRPSLLTLDVAPLVTPVAIGWCRSELASEFEQASTKNLRWSQPGRSVCEILIKNTARIEQVVNIQHPLELGSSYPNDLCQTQVDLGPPILE